MPAIGAQIGGDSASRRGWRHADRRIVLVRVHSHGGRVPHAVSLSALLLQHLPQDLGRRGICRLHHGRGRVARGTGSDRDRYLAGAHLDDTGVVGTPGPSPARRHFCKLCRSALWIDDSRFPNRICPLASAIDTALPVPPERVHMMVDFAAPWVTVPAGRGDRRFPRNRNETMLDWHRRHGLYLGAT